MKSSSGGNDSPNKAWARALEMTAPIARNPTVTFPVLIDMLAERFDSAPALLSDRGELTYRALAERSNQYASWALERGLAPGQTVCLLMANSPDYLAIWLGITKIGGIVALLNTNLVGVSMAHAIGVVGPRQIIASYEFADKLAAIQPRLAPEIEIWSHGENRHGFRRIDHEIASMPGDAVAASGHKAPTLADRALYIYTSGTTGLPKAANVSHFRIMQWSHWFAGMADTRASDRMYNCLPMYHSVGGVVAIGAMLVNGGSVALRERFSATRFWDDIVEWNCTLFQYIGELCRYLVNSPPHPRETAHRLRLCCGNGLRAGVWEQFQRRFQIPRILEFYAATEGNFSLYNCEGKPGTIGRIPSFLAHRFPMALVQFDTDTGAPKRGPDGFCIRSSTNEIGEAIGKIAHQESASTARFEGYVDRSASEQKILRDVFIKGDAWFRSGDLMRKDGQGFFHFVDRVGDTFRWKGENVSTTEVAEIIRGCPGVIDAVVYGVGIPAAEGRAGMATVVTDDGFELAALRAYLIERLPDYARPLFLRISDHIEMTATFKSRKEEFLREGYNPSATAEPIYFDDRDRQAYVILEAALYENIQTGKIRL
jgi:fatty-acyl-CoA synthase